MRCYTTVSKSGHLFDKISILVALIRLLYVYPDGLFFNFGRLVRPRAHFLSYFDFPHFRDLVPLPTQQEETDHVVMNPLS